VKVLLSLLCAGGLAAQTIEIQGLGNAAPLNGIWKQKIGDDPAWADPAFDDAAWNAIEMPQPARPGERGITWYRLRVHLATLPPQPLHVMVGPLFPAYEIFANGTLIGRYGGPLGADKGQWYAAPAIFPLPAAADLVIAIRTEDRGLRYGAQNATREASQSWIGTEAALKDKAAAWQFARRTGTEPLRVIIVILLAGSGFLIALAVHRRRSYEYLYIGLFMAFNGLFRVVQVAPEWLGDPDRLMAGYFGTTVALGSTFAMVLFARTLFDAKPITVTWLCILLYSITPVVAAVRPLNDWLYACWPWFEQWSVAIAIWMEVVIYVDFARRATRRENFLPVHLAAATYFGANIIFYTTNALGKLTLGGEWLTPMELALRSAIMLFLFAMGIILTRRSAHQDREQGRLEQELAAAAEVQKLLLPARSVSGVEAVYEPASEVGGDFYQILERPGGARLIVVGDVSGKGLKAAMLVSVMVGALRQSRQESPAAILGDLNRVLAGQAGHGFVTCACLRVEANGTLTLANAGHPAPYVDGAEWVIEGGLPLGVLPDGAYSEFRTAPAEVITLVSDGVLEAANTRGELFGFDRTREMSMKSSQEIAEAARAWGQNDDITVVTVQRRA
jgi:hypothetical protein